MADIIDEESADSVVQSGFEQDGIDGRELEPWGGMGAPGIHIASHTHHRSLERCLSLFQLQGFSVACFPWAYVFVDGNFLVGWTHGGPISLIYGWVLAMAGTLLVTLSLAEVASACPNIGGLYYYSARLAARGYKGVAGFMTAWCNITGVLTSLSYLVLQLAWVIGNMRYAITYDTVQGTGQLTSARELIYIYLTLILLIGVLASVPSRMMSFYLTFSMCLSIITFFSFPVTLLLLAPTHRTVDFVFNSWQDHSDATGITSKTFTFILGSMAAISTLTGWDTTIYMTEESLRPTYTVPAALHHGFWWVTVCGGLSLVMLLFVIQEPDALLSITAEFGGTSPVSQILWDLTMARLGSGSASAVFLVLLAMALFLMCLFLVIGSSRKLYAMSRDHLVFGSAWWSVLHPRLLIPLASTWAIICVEMLMGLTLLADNTQALFTIFMQAWLPLTLMSYLLPILMCLTTLERLQPGPWNMGAYGPYVRTGAAAYLVLAIVISVLPLTYPVTDVTIPYTPIMWIGYMGFMQLCWWLPGIGGRHFYSGPVSERLGRVNFAIASPFLTPPQRKSRYSRILTAAAARLSHILRAGVVKQGSVRASASGLVEPQVPAGYLAQVWRTLWWIWGPGKRCTFVGCSEVGDSARSSPNNFYRQPTLRIPGEHEALNRALSSPRHPAGYAGKKQAPKRASQCESVTQKVDSNRKT